MKIKIGIYLVFDNFLDGLDISNIYSSSALYFKVKANKLPKIQIFLSSYKGKIRRISKIIEKNNIHEINDRIYEVSVFH